MNGGHRAVGQFEHGLKRRDGLYTCAFGRRIPLILVRSHCKPAGTWRKFPQNFVATALKLGY